MSNYLRRCLYLSIIIAKLITQCISIDCSQYNDFASCFSIQHCLWSDGACRCASNAAIDILFTISTSAYIGQDRFNNTITPFLKNMAAFGVQSSSRSRTGFNVFSSQSTLYNITDRTWDEMDELIDNINTNYDAGDANLPQTFPDILRAFPDYKQNMDRIALDIMIMGTNPYSSNSNGPDQPLEVCRNASDLKRNGIQVLFVGIGDLWKKERIDCLVLDKDNDIIRIDSLENITNALPLILNRMCPTIPEMKITEVKASNNNNPRFIELFNRGIAIEQSDVLSLNGLIDGFITNVSINQGQYFVLFNDDDNGTISCSSCNDSKLCTVNSNTNLCEESVYIPCGNGNGNNCVWNDNMDLTDWNIQITANYTNASNYLIENVSYANDDYWIEIRDGYSYELNYEGYSNKYGANWVQSCDMKGTPGAVSRDCNVAELQCDDDSDCQLNDDDDASCGSSSNTCSCSTDAGFYPSGTSCAPIPPPGSCEALLVSNGTQKYMQFSFDGADIDESHRYALTYYTNSVNLDTIVDYSRVRAVTDYYFNANDSGESIAGYVQTVFTIDGSNYVSQSWDVTCAISTQSPTETPTYDPTNAPTLAPSPAPTSAPTWQVPKMYLSGDFCENDRCECVDKGFGCCANQSDWRNSNDTICNLQTAYFTAGISDKILTQIKVYPQTFPFVTNVCWDVLYNGTTKDVPDMDHDNDNNDSSHNPLGIVIEPMNGCVSLNGSTTFGIELSLNQSNIKCPQNNSDCLNELVSVDAIFKLALKNCSSGALVNGNECLIVYPSELYLFIGRSDLPSGGGGGGGNNKIDTWVWIVLIVGVLFLGLLSWLMYRYWFKNRKQSDDYQQITDNIEFQEKQNDDGMQGDLGNNDVQFNPLATGVPGLGFASDPMSIEREKRENAVKNQMAAVDAEKFVVKEEMGQVLQDKRITSPLLDI